MLPNGTHELIKIVAPLVGAWIEMLPNGTHELIKIVAPLVGAWIEIKEV